MKILLYVNDGLCVLAIVSSEQSPTPGPSPPLDLHNIQCMEMTESPVLGILFAIPPIAV